MASASAGGGNPGQQVMAAALLARRAAAGAGDSRSSAFSLTCSRLSQYLKEKGGALNLGGIGVAFDAAANKGTSSSHSRPETPRTMNLLPGIDSSSNSVPEAVALNKLTAPPPTEQQLLPPTAAVATAPAPQPPRGAPMTIFYGGKVIVFDNYPADKAKELLALAGRGASTTPPKPQGSSVGAATAAAALRLPVKAATVPAGVSPAAVADGPAPAPATVVPASPAIIAAAAPATAAAPVPQKPPQIPLASDLPIARRVSLNRFLEKRKDRIQSKAPYPVNTASSSDGKSSLDKDKHQPAIPLLDKEKQPQPTQQQHSWLGLAPWESL